MLTYKLIIISYLKKINRYININYYINHKIY